MKSRPVQYLGLLLLVLASLTVIFFPIGAKPKPTNYTVTLEAPKPFQQLVGSTKKVGDEADNALAKEFSDKEKVPGALTLQTGGQSATIQDEASTQAEAQARADRIVKALNTKFKGVKLAASFSEDIAKLPEAPLVPLGDKAIYPINQRDSKPFPAIKLGLDLQGGVNLVMQVRRAQFSYNVTSPLTDKTKPAFLEQVRAALAATSEDLGLQNADVSFDSNSATLLNVRAQPANKEVFDAQKKALDAAMKTVKDATIVPARAQFYDPNAGNDQNGFGGNRGGEMLSKTVEIIRSRVDKLGVSEPVIQAQLPDRIIVQLPGVNDPQRAVDIIGQTAQMQIVLLPEDIEPRPDPKDANNTLFFDRKTGNPIDGATVRGRSQLLVNGTDVRPNTRAGFSQNNKPAIFFELQGEGSKKFAQTTSEVAGKGRFIPIFLDDRCISAPTVESPITGGEGQISGGFKDIQEANNLAVLLNSGALPAPIDVIENRTISATLGSDSLTKSLRAGFIGLLAVAVFMIVFYRLPGVLANCALVIYLVLNLAVFVLIGGTLTLPGIAGFLLALAMSLDTNILVFERLKEEMVIQPTFAAALRAAFSRAWTAILDSHVTTLIASVVLFYFGTGPVKGFALTLAIGVLLSLFSAISVTRLFMWSVASAGEKNRGLFAGKLPDVKAVHAHSTR